MAAVFGPVGAAVTFADLLVAGNNDSSTLAGDINSSQTTLQVPTGEGTRFVINQAIVLDQEALRVDGIAGDVLTVTRGLDGTAAVAHLSGTVIADRPIAKHHNQPAEEIYAIEQFLTNGFTRNVKAGGFRIIEAADPRASPTGDQDYVTQSFMNAFFASLGGPGRFTNPLLLMGA